ncbi:MAG: hypothetical protein WC460_04885 [Patescibacteria group bacterium]
MRLNRITIICLAIAGLLTSGVLLAKAAGFVSYEPNADPQKTKIILWDNVKIAPSNRVDCAADPNSNDCQVGLNISDSGSAVSAGNVFLGNGRDLFIKKSMGFDCADYPATPKCNTQIGDTGSNIFLQIGQISGQNLVLQSQSSGISLGGTSLEITGKIILASAKDLIMTANPITLTPNSVFSDNLQVNEIIDLPGSGLAVSLLKLNQGSFFLTNKLIQYTPPLQ